MLRMLDRHAVQELLRAGVKTRAVAQQFRVSRRTIERIAREAAIRSDADGIIRREGDHPGARSVGRPQVTAALRARVQALVLDDPERPPGRDLPVAEGGWDAAGIEHRLPRAA
jgi:hypothetical protein